MPTYKLAPDTIDDLRALALQAYSANITRLPEREQERFAVMLTTLQVDPKPLATLLYKQGYITRDCLKVWESLPDDLMYPSIL